MEALNSHLANFTAKFQLYIVELNGQEYKVYERNHSAAVQAVLIEYSGIDTWYTGSGDLMSDNGMIMASGQDTAVLNGKIVAARPA